MSNTIEQGVPIQQPGADASEYPFTPDVARKRAEVAQAPKQIPQPPEAPLASHPAFEKAEQTAMALTGIIAGVGPGVASAVEVLRAAQNPPPAIVQTYEGSYDFNTPYKVKVPATATPLSKEGQQGTEQPILSLPSATLTEGETHALAQAFPDAKGPQFSNVFSTISVDSSERVTGLPFEKDSPADKLAQSYRTIIATANQLKGQPDVLVGRNTEQGTIAIVVRITNPITPKGGRTYTAGTFMYIDQTNSFGYLELTPRPGGEKDVLKLFVVDKKYQAHVETFYIGPKENPQQLKAPAIGQFTVAQVDEKENAQVVLAPGLAISLFDTGDASVPKATPQPGTSADLPTPLAPEVRAKRVEPNAAGEYTIIPQEELKKTGFTSGIEMKINDHPVRIETNISNLNINGIDKAMFERAISRLGISIYNENVIEIHDIKDWKPSMNPNTYEILQNEKKEKMEIYVKPTRNADNTKIIHRLYISPVMLKPYNKMAVDGSGRYVEDLAVSESVLSCLLVSVTMTGDVFPKLNVVPVDDRFFMKTSFTPAP